MNDPLESLGLSPRNLKEDRRTQRTRRLLRSALTSLMLEKRYDSITVQDIIDRADVGRSTFYAHFQDKDELAESNLAEIMESMAQAVERGDQADWRLMPGRELFQHIQDFQQTFKALARGGALDMFFEKGQAYWSQRLETSLRSMLPPEREPSIELPVVCSYISGTFVTLFKWWLENKMPYPPERMDEIIQALVMPGVRQALGISDQASTGD